MTITENSTWLHVPLTVSLGLSCGCTRPPRGGVTNLDMTGPGLVTICDVHDEYAVITRVTARLDGEDEATLARLLRDKTDLDEDAAGAIVHEQARWRTVQAADRRAAR